MIEVMSVTIKVVQILFLFFLAMMAPDSGLNLTSFDFENITFENWTDEGNTDDNSGCEAQVCKSKYRRRNIITRSWFETALNHKLRTLDPKIEEFPCLVHKLSVTLTALQYEPQLKMG